MKIHLLIILIYTFILFSEEKKLKKIENKVKKVKKVKKEKKEKNELCLVSPSEAKSILLEKYNIVKEEKDIDVNLRFILGKCSPIILVPGIFSTRLKIEIDCEQLFEKEKENYKSIQFFCEGSSICRTNKKFTDTLFLSMTGPFGILFGKDDYINVKEYIQNNFDNFDIKNFKGACLGFLLTFFNKEDECPKTKEDKEICNHSDHIKIYFDGGDDETEKNSKCGLNSVAHVTEKDLSSTRVFGDIIKNLTSVGYKEGFSLGSIPYDFRRFIATNEFATKIFRFQIENLYNITGKKVIIVAHSFGTLNTLNNLIYKENKDLIPKIKKFIAIGPPFAGATKLLDAFLHGLTDFNTFFTHFYKFGQYLMLKSVPTITELKPFPFLSQLFSDDYYSDFAQAIRQRIYMETICSTKKCSTKDFEKQKKFDNIFKDYFPSLGDEECKYEINIKNQEDAYNKKCMTQIYNVGDCPIFIALNKLSDNLNLNLSYCNKTDDNLYYSSQCEGEKKCYKEIFSKGPYAYGMKDMDDFIFLYNYYKGHKLKDKIDISYFKNEEEYREEIKYQNEYQDQISLIKELPIPPIDTEIIYSSFNPTLNGEYVDKNDFIKKGVPIMKGGDGTVPTYSSLLTGLKWIYDKQKENLPQEIKLVEYCSRLSKEGKYAFNDKIDQKFVALNCKCLKNKDEYKDKKDLDDCSHQNMLMDKNLIDYIIYSVSKENNTSNQDLLLAIQNYSNTFDYEGYCNFKLKFFAQNYDEFETCQNELLITEKDFNQKFCSQFLTDKKKSCCSVHVAGKNGKNEKIEYYFCNRIEEKSIDKWKNKLIDKKKFYEDEFLENVEVLCNEKFIYFNIFLIIFIYIMIFF